MSTSIEWTKRPGTKGETWNPVVGCTKKSAGCKHCYAKLLHDKRHKAYLAGKLQNIPQYAAPFEQVQLMPDRLTLPLKWKAPRTIFVNSVSDLFHEDVPFEFIDQVFAVMALCPQHTFQILTKRPERMAEYFARTDIYTVWLPISATGIEVVELQHPLPHVWLGASVENKPTADERIPHLLKCPAAVRFLSCEPLLAILDLENRLCKWPEDEDGAPYPGGIDWVIAGGESGHGARPMHPDWVSDLRDQCAAAGVPFFFKQWGAWSPGSALDFDRNIILLNTGKQLPYVRYDQHATKHELDNWASMNPNAMHKAFGGKKGAGNVLDGKKHLAWPVVNELTNASA